MKIPKIEIAPGELIPQMGIGTWGMGGLMKKSPYNDDKNDVEQIIYQIQQGLTAVDCWVLQAGGHTLKLISQAIKQFKRSDLFLIAKFDVKFFVRPEDVTHTMDKYLEALNTDYVDMIQIHSPKYDALAAQSAMSEMDNLIDSGKARYFGIANADVIALREHLRLSRHPITSNEINYSVIDRAYADNGTLDFCRGQGIKIISYKPLARGAINYLTIDPLFKELAEKYQMTVNQIAFAWLLSQPDIFVWMKSANRSHINENMDSFNFSISKADLGRISSWKYNQT